MKLPSRYAMLAACAAAISAPSALAQTRCTAQSPSHAVALVELYTSEGCDSCPPADRWLSGIREAGVGADQAILLALHVDYWDQLGWKDRFGNARFSERQRALSALAKSRTVYTPEVFLNLREVRGWSSAAQFRRAVKAINAKAALADIGLELETASTAQLHLKATFSLKTAAAPAQAQGFVALFENKLSTDVRAGENRGVTLRHDYVVREWLGPIEIRGGMATSVARSVALHREWKQADLGVAAFVQDLGTRQILQAAALPACNSAG